MKNQKLENPFMASGLSEFDWNFDNVPKAELEICCLWEYARESAFFRSIRERGRQAVEMNLSVRERLDFVERDFRKAWTLLGRKAILFQEGIYGFGGDEPVPNFASRFPIPWQSLAPNERMVLLESTAWSAKNFVDLPGFRRGDRVDPQVLANLFRPKSLKEIFGREDGIGLREFHHSGHKLRALCPNLLSPSGIEILVVHINWGDFTNEQLVQQFAEWLKENDPPGIERPDKRGRKRISDRVKLERLAIMRLLHRFTLTELRAGNPVAWKRYNSANRRWRKDIEKSHVYFREAFPFLAKDELPRSWPPKETPQVLI